MSLDRLSFKAFENSIARPLPLSQVHGPTVPTTSTTPHFRLRWGVDPMCILPSPYPLTPGPSPRV